METKFVEVTNGPRNWGKFCIARFEQDEWLRPSVVAPELSMLAGRGWTPKHVLILDLQTGEGAVFRPGGLPSADLNKHRVWVCPLFEPFLEWLYQQPDPFDVPDHVDLPEAEFLLAGYRRPGSEPCWTCGGDPKSHPSGLECICEDGTHESEVANLRLAALHPEERMLRDDIGAKRG